MRVTANSHELMSQATYTAEVYLRDAIEAIDKVTRPGYAIANPCLIGAFMRTAAQDYDTACKMQSADLIAAAIDETIFHPEIWAENIGDFGAVRDGLETIANAIRGHE